MIPQSRINLVPAVRMVGVLETIRHPAAVVNGVKVPGWSEVRVTGVRVR